MAYYDELTNFIRHDLKYLFLEPMRQKRAEDRADKKLKEREAKDTENKINELMITNLSNQVNDVSKNWDSEATDFDRVKEGLNAASAKFEDNPLLIAQLDLLGTNLDISSGRIEGRNTAIGELDAIKDQILTGFKDEDLSTDIDSLIENLKTAKDTNSSYLLKQDKKTADQQLKVLQENTNIYNMMRALDDKDAAGFQVALGDDAVKDQYLLAHDLFRQGLPKRAEQEFIVANRLLNKHKDHYRDYSAIKDNYVDEEGEYKGKNKIFSYEDKFGIMHSDQTTQGVIDQADLWAEQGEYTKALNIIGKLPLVADKESVRIKKEAEGKISRKGEEVNNSLNMIQASIKNIGKDKEGKIISSHDEQVTNILESFQGIYTNNKNRLSPDANEQVKRKVNSALADLYKRGELGSRSLYLWDPTADESMLAYIDAIDTAKIYNVEKAKHEAAAGKEQSQPLLDEKGDPILYKHILEEQFANELERNRGKLQGEDFMEFGDFYFTSDEVYDQTVVDQMLNFLDARKGLQDLLDLQAQL